MWDGAGGREENPSSHGRGEPGGRPYPPCPRAGAGGSCLPAYPVSGGVRLPKGRILLSSRVPSRFQGHRHPAPKLHPNSQGPHTLWCVYATNTKSSWYWKEQQNPPMLSPGTGKLTSPRTDGSTKKPTRIHPFAVQKHGMASLT